jgi:hypothetical protein
MQLASFDQHKGVLIEQTSAFGGIACRTMAMFRL